MIRHETYLKSQTMVFIPYTIIISLLYCLIKAKNKTVERMKVKKKTKMTIYYNTKVIIILYGIMQVAFHCRFFFKFFFFLILLFTQNNFEHTVGYKYDDQWLIGTCVCLRSKIITIRR